LLGGIRDVTVRLLKTIRPRIIKAQIRIVQPKPTCGISLLTMIGKMTPPSEEPATARPSAAPRFLRNQVLVCRRIKKD